MRVIHRVTISFKLDKKAFRKLTKLGIEPWASGSPSFSSVRFFDISEDDPVWPQVSEIIKNYKIPTISRAEFSKEEILSAEWVWLKPVYFDEDLYPEPQEENILWKKSSFAYENECPYCGTGLLQKNPIRLKREPILRDNDFISVLPIYLISARPEVLDIMTQNGITGIEIFSAINHSTDKPLETIKQMKVINELPPGLIADNLKLADVERMTADETFTHAPYPCGHFKYYGTEQVMMKYNRSVFKDAPDLVRTNEWFGVVYAANQLILASAKFVKLYIENNWKGLSLAPIELV